MSEKIFSPGLPDIGARKLWDFLILTVQALGHFGQFLGVGLFSPEMFQTNFNMVGYSIMGL